MCSIILTVKIYLFLVLISSPVVKFKMPAAGCSHAKLMFVIVFTSFPPFTDN